MATRMQQRRGTAAEWTAADPVLAAGEFGYETDTGKFKIGDGINVWSSLTHFSDAAALLGAAPASLDTLAELAAAVNDDPDFYTTVAANATAIAANAADIVTANAAIAQNTADMIAGDQTLEGQITAIATSTTDAIAAGNLLNSTARDTLQANLEASLDTVSGTATSALTLAGSADSKADTANTSIAAEIVNRSAAVASVTDAIGAVAADLLTEEGARADGDAANATAISDEATARAAALSAHNSATLSVHGIADTSVLATDTDVANAQAAAESYADGLAVNYDAAGTAATAQTAAQSFATSAVSTHSSDTVGVHGIADTSLLVTTGGAIFTGKLTLDSDPTQALHAATKQYVDSAQAGLSTKPQVVAASTANVSGTYDNGTAGVGATLNLGQLSSLDIDGVTSWTLLDGILLKDQTAAAENGRWVVDQIGNGTDTDWILRRCSLCDTADEIPGAYIFVIDGTTNNQTGWVLHVADPATFTVGTDAITAYQFAGAGSVTAGTNILVNGNEVSLSADPSLSDATITNLDITNLVFSDGTQTAVGVPSITTINAKTASYELASVTERDTIVEVDSASATTVTIPAESSVNFPVGTTLDVIQTGTGQVTIAGAVGVTVNATPGLKLRAQWSSVTLLKRASDSWIVFGDTAA